MTQTTKIEWCKATWNPAHGCDAVSPGCERCYARAFAKRLAGRCGYDKDDPFAVTLRPERLAEPFGLTGRQRVFVCSMGDLFHPDVPAYFIRAVLAVISLAGEHTFVLLTKRPALMHAFFMTQRLPGRAALARRLSGRGQGVHQAGSPDRPDRPGRQAPSIAAMARSGDQRHRAEPLAAAEPDPGHQRREPGVPRPPP